MPIYSKYSPKSEIEEFKKAMLSRSSVLRKAYQQENIFLAHALRHIKRTYRKIGGEEQKWIDEEAIVEI